MQVLRFGLPKFSSWWPSPRVWPSSWQITRFLQAGVLYFAVLKYVSLTFTVPWTIWSPVAQIEAMPSQPLLPYLFLQTSTRPLVGRQFRGDLAATTLVSKTVDTLQSTAAPARDASQTAETLSPTLKLNGLAIRPQ